MGGVYYFVFSTGSIISFFHLPSFKYYVSKSVMGIKTILILLKFEESADVILEHSQRTKTDIERKTSERGQTRL